MQQPANGRYNTRARRCQNGQGQLSDTQDEPAPRHVSRMPPRLPRRPFKLKGRPTTWKVIERPRITTASEPLIYLYTVHQLFRANSNLLVGRTSYKQQLGKRLTSNLDNLADVTRPPCFNLWLPPSWNPKIIVSRNMFKSRWKIIFLEYRGLIHRIVYLIHRFSTGRYHFGSVLIYFFPNHCVKSHSDHPLHLINCQA